MTVDGFDLDSPLVCEGIIGDGCGGGRLFVVENKTLFAYDPMTQEKFTLVEELQSVQSISKSACLITLVLKGDNLIFDLSKLELIKNEF